MTTPIHVLCSTVTKIVRREVGETMPCFADKNKCGFFAAVLRPFGRRQKFVAKRAT